MEIFKNLGNVDNTNSYSIRAGGVEIGCKIIFECEDEASFHT